MEKKMKMMPSMTAVTASIILMSIVSFPGAANAQLFGQYTTAVPSPEGEGGLFVSAGDGTFRVGPMARFMINGRMDIGFQLGFDRYSGHNSYGAGADLKYYILGEDTTLPVDLAVDLSLGHLRSGDFSRTFFELGMLASGMLNADTELPVEPYGSVGIISTYLHDDEACAGPDPLCGYGGNGSETDVVIRGGAKLYLSSEYQVLLELSVDDEISFGGAFNVVF